MKNLKVLDTLLFGFSNLKTFILSINSHPVILRGAEGEVAESIIQHNPRPSGEGDRRRRWVRARQEHFSHPSSALVGISLPREKDILR